MGIKLRVLSDGTADNCVVVDQDGDIVEGVIDIHITIERGHVPVARITLDGVDVDVRAEIKNLIN